MHSDNSTDDSDDADDADDTSAGGCGTAGCSGFTPDDPERSDIGLRPHQAGGEAGHDRGTHRRRDPVEVTAKFNHSVNDNAGGN